MEDWSFAELWCNRADTVKHLNAGVITVQSFQTLYSYNLYDINNAIRICLTYLWSGRSLNHKANLQ